MKPEPSIFDVADEEAEARREAVALADLEAGRTISHKAMKAWLLSWGKPDELPPPQVGD
jgi:predicted transcriptional regulator